MRARLVDYAPAATSATHSLAALMYLDAARLPGRVDESGDLTRLFDQDRSRWDKNLIAEGLALLELSATGDELSDFHIEAAIAGMHAGASRVEDTPWSQIVALYDVLARIRPSPVVELNRAMALAQVEGPERGLEAVRTIGGVDRLGSYPFYEAALGELELRCGRNEIAQGHFRAALKLARKRRAAIPGAPHRRLRSVSMVCARRSPHHRAGGGTSSGRRTACPAHRDHGFHGIVITKRRQNPRRWATLYPAD